MSIWMGTTWCLHIQSSINLGETLFRITCQWITALTGCLYINHLSYPSFLTIFLGREKWKICEQNEIITVRIPLRWKEAKMLVTLMLFLESLRAKEKNKLLSTERVTAWFTIKTFIFFMVSCYFVIIQVYWCTLSLI